MDYKKLICNYIRSLGLDTFGFTECRKFIELKDMLEFRKENNIENEFEAKNIDERINPFLYMEKGKTIISIAFPYLYNKEVKTPISFSKYTQGVDYHSVLKVYLEKICGYIQSIGGEAFYFVDSNALPERYIAYLCGVGFKGKNNMIITEKYGSFVFLGEIITNLTIESNTPKESLCGKCERCLKACPTSSLPLSNPNICLSYITQKKQIDEKWFDKFNGRLFGCDTCQMVCPFNKDINFSNIEEFKPMKYMEEPVSDEIIYMDNKSFKEKYKITSCGWRGKNVLSRNMLINAMKKGINIDKSKLKSPYILEYYEMLNKHINK